jgi:hypothetical protein
MVTLGDGAPVGGATVTLFSASPVVTVPTLVTIPANQTAQTFTASTVGPLMDTRVVSVSATYLSFKQTASLTVTPAASPALSGVTVTPNPVVTGNTAQGTVTLSGTVTVPVTIGLFSNNAIASVPASVTVQVGQTQANFPIAITRGPVGGTATITATFLGVSKSVVLVVQ